METYETECQIECIENGNCLDAEIDRFSKGKYLSVYMNTIKINLQYDKRSDSYIGSMAGLEFITKGPKLMSRYR